MNRPPLSSVANLPPTSNISAAFQGCSFQGCTINIIQKKPEFDPEEQLRDVDVSNWLIAAGDWGVRSFEFKTAQICRRIASAFVQIRRKRP